MANTHLSVCFDSLNIYYFVVGVVPQNRNFAFEIFVCVLSEFFFTLAPKFVWNDLECLKDYLF